MRELALLALLAVSFGQSGCAWMMADQVHFKVSEGEPAATCVPSQSVAERPFMFGVALSGGGSRAAVFGAAALEALWEHGVLREVSYISSVSGGSFAAAYFGAYPPDCNPEDTKCWRSYFSDIKAKMRTSLLTPTMTRNLRPWRLGSPTRRVTSFQEILDDRLFKGKTFRELARDDAALEREGANVGPRPIFLINGASYDTGRRFVFSSLCLPDPLDAASTAKIDRRSMRAQSFSLSGCARTPPDDLPLSLAVATSAGFPIAFGPVVIEASAACEGGEPRWWHLGDGGLVDNSGADMLEEIAVREARAGRIKGGLIFSMDSGRRSPGGLDEVRDLSIWTSSEKARFTDMPRFRADAFHGLWWDAVASRLREAGTAIDVAQVRYIDAQLERWPSSCLTRLREAAPTESIRAEIQKQLGSISTALSISDCDADLIEWAAHQLVHERLNGDLLGSLREAGYLAAREVDPGHRLDE